MSGAGLGGALVGATQLQALRDPHCGHLFVFRGKRGGLIKVLWHDGQGLWPVGQATGARPHRMAAHRGRGGDDHAGAAWLSAGRHRLAIAAAVMAA
jgi:transposase